MMSDVMKILREANSHWVNGCEIDSLSTGPLARPFTLFHALLTHILALQCLLLSGTLLCSFVCLFPYSLAPVLMGKRFLIVIRKRVNFMQFPPKVEAGQGFKWVTGAQHRKEAMAWKRNTGHEDFFTLTLWSKMKKKTQTK